MQLSLVDSNNLQQTVDKSVTIHQQQIFQLQNALVQLQHQYNELIEKFSNLRTQQLKQRASSKQQFCAQQQDKDGAGLRIGEQARVDIALQLDQEQTKVQDLLIENQMLRQQLVDEQQQKVVLKRCFQQLSEINKSGKCESNCQKLKTENMKLKSRLERHVSQMEDYVTSIQQQHERQFDVQQLERQNLLYEAQKSTKQIQYFKKVEQTQKQQIALLMQQIDELKLKSSIDLATYNSQCRTLVERNQALILEVKRLSMQRTGNVNLSRKSLRKVADIRATSMRDQLYQLYDSFKTQQKVE